MSLPSMSLHNLFSFLLVALLVATNVNAKCSPEQGKYCLRVQDGPECPADSVSASDDNSKFGKAEVYRWREATFFNNAMSEYKVTRYTYMNCKNDNTTYQLFSTALNSPYNLSGAIFSESSTCAWTFVDYIKSQKHIKSLSFLMSTERGCLENAFANNDPIAVNITEMSLADTDNGDDGSSAGGFSGHPKEYKNNNDDKENDASSMVKTYQTAMIILYAVSGVVLGLFVLVVVLNFIKNRMAIQAGVLPPGTGPTGQPPRQGIARAVLDSFPVYLFSLNGSGQSGNGDELEKGKTIDGKVNASEDILRSVETHDIAKADEKEDTTDLTDGNGDNPNETETDTGTETIKGTGTNGTHAGVAGTDAGVAGTDAGVAGTDADTDTAGTTAIDTTKEAVTGTGSDNSVEDEIAEEADIITVAPSVPSSPTVLPQTKTNVQPHARSLSVQSAPALVDVASIADEQPTCPICLDDFESGEELRILPCRHQYHTMCIDPWLLDVSPLCPMCKADYTSWNMGDGLGSVSTDTNANTIESTLESTSDAQNYTPSNGSSPRDGPHAFPHFRWAHYLRTIRRAGRRSIRRSGVHSVIIGRSRDRRQNVSESSAGNVNGEGLARAASDPPISSSGSQQIRLDMRSERASM